MVSKKDYIQEAAYFIWLNRGRPENQDLAIWDEATKLYELTHSEEKSESKVVKTKSSKKVATKKTPAKKAVVKKAPAKKVAVKKSAPKTKIKIVVGSKK